MDIPTFTMDDLAKADQELITGKALEPRDRVDGCLIVPGKTVKLLGGHHRQTHTSGKQLTRLMPNIGGPLYTKTILKSVAHSIMLNGAPVWVEVISSGYRTTYQAKR